MEQLLEKLKLQKQSRDNYVKTSKEILTEINEACKLDFELEQNGASVSFISKYLGIRIDITFNKIEEYCLDNEFTVKKSIVALLNRSVY